MFILTELASGDLEITLDAVDETERLELIEEINEKLEQMDDISLLFHGTDSYWTNGSYQPFDAGKANPFVGLTNSPCVAESMTYDDEGNADIEGKHWWFPNYQVESFIDTLINKGSVIFTQAD